MNAAVSNQGPADWCAVLDLPGTCRIEVAEHILDEYGQILDSLIGFAFDTLHVRCLAIRVLPSSPGTIQVCAHGDMQSEELLDHAEL